MTIRDIFDRIIIIIDPKWWHMNDDYDNEWDKELCELMKKYKFTNNSTYYTELNGYKMWIANYPYAVFTKPIHDVNGDHHFNLPRPSRLTIMKAERKMKYDLWMAGLPQQKKRGVLLDDILK